MGMSGGGGKEQVGWRDQAGRSEGRQKEAV